MRTDFICLCLLSILFYSCEKEEKNVLTPLLPEENNSKESDGQKNNTLEWRDIYSTSIEAENAIYIGTKYSTLRSVAVDNDPLIHVGGVYPKETFAVHFDKEITDSINPIAITFDFPTPFMREKLKRGRMSYLKIFKEAIHSKEYDSYIKKRRKTLHRIRLAKMKSYEDIKTVFKDNPFLGESIKHSISQRYGKKPQNLMIGEIIFKSFSVSMETPPNGFFKTNKRNYESDNPVYIRSITYGSVGYFIIESKYSYSEVVEGFKNSFENTDLLPKKIVKNSKITLYTISDISRQAYRYQTFEDLAKYLDNPFYSDYYYGFPIYCTGCYTKDNSFFSVD